jgi:hypothetical protein
VINTCGDKTKPDGARKAPSDAPEAGDDVYHIFKLDLGLHFSVVRIRAVGENEALESTKFCSTSRIKTKTC